MPTGSSETHSLFISVGFLSFFLGIISLSETSLHSSANVFCFKTKVPFTTHSKLGEKKASSCSFSVQTLVNWDQHTVVLLNFPQTVDVLHPRNLSHDINTCHQNTGEADSGQLSTLYLSLSTTLDKCLSSSRNSTHCNCLLTQIHRCLQDRIHCVCLHIGFSGQTSLKGNPPCAQACWLNEPSALKGESTMNTCILTSADRHP